tara:strand:- start:856 stop:1290 length:435 start_codon:yes stop_codon:yes gene_type:complete
VFVERRKEKDMVQVVSVASQKTSMKPSKVAPKAKTNGVGKVGGNGTIVPQPKTTGKGSARTLYKYSGKYPENVDKFTPQMLALIDTVQEAADDKSSSLDPSSFTGQDLVALAVKKGHLTTKQDKLRIFRFYQKRLVEEGYFIKL